MKIKYEEDFYKFLKEQDQKNVESSMKSRYEGDVSKFEKEQDHKNMEISRLKQEMETMKTKYEGDISKLMREQGEKDKEMRCCEMRCNVKNPVLFSNFILFDQYTP